MRISDWSSDVCSSDLLAEGVGFGTGEIAAVAAVQLLDLAIVRGKQDVPAAERLAPHRAGAIFLAAAVERDRGVEIEFEPVAIGLGLDVDHARERKLGRAPDRDRERHALWVTVICG